MYKLAQEIFNDIKNQYINDNRIRYNLSFKDMSAIDKQTYIHACDYLENKGLIHVDAKASGFYEFSLTAFGIDMFEEERRIKNMDFYDFLDFMNEANIQRNDVKYPPVKVILRKEEEQIDFPPDIEYIPKVGDKVNVNGKTYTITDVEENRPFNNQLYCYQASYKNKTPSAKPGDIFNIHGNVSGSIIGSQQTANITNINEATSQLREIINKEVTDPLDKELLEKMTTYVEMLIENNQPIQKGALSKFSDILVKYAPVLSATGMLIIQWLKSKP